MPFGAVESMVHMRRAMHWVHDLEAAPQLQAGSSRLNTEGQVDVSADCVGGFKIIRAQKYLQRWRDVAHGRSTRANTEALLDEMLSDILARRMIHDAAHGKVGPRLDDLWARSLLVARGAYFPELHWDTCHQNWPTQGGFNLWYMIETPAAKFAGKGSMFLAHTDDPSVLSGADPVVRFWPTPGGGWSKVLHSVFPVAQAPLPVDGPAPMLLRQWPSTNATGLRFSYLNVTAGDLLLFCKRTLHMSDPRLYLHGDELIGRLRRQAMNVRVLVKPRGQNVFPVWPGSALFAKAMQHEQWRDTWLTANRSPFAQEQRTYGRYDLLWDYGGERARKQRRARRSREGRQARVRGGRHSTP